jgi:hypothetical protein
MLDPASGRLHGQAVTAERKGGIFLFISAHVEDVLLRESENELVHTAAHAMEGVTDDQGKQIGKWLQKFCVQNEAPFGIAFFEGSVAVARPIFDKCFDVYDVGFGSAEFAAVAP